MYPQTAAKQAYGNGGAGYDIPTERSTVGNELAQQQKSLADAHAVVSALADRLAPLLSPNPGEAAGSGPEPNPTTVLQTVQSHNRSLRVLAARVQTLLDRIEL